MVETTTPTTGLNHLPVNFINLNDISYHISSTCCPIFQCSYYSVQLVIVTQLLVLAKLCILIPEINLSYLMFSNDKSLLRCLQMYQ